MQRLPATPADDLVGKAAAVQCLGLVQRLYLVGPGQGLHGQFGQLRWRCAEMQRCTLRLQITRLAHAL